MTSKASRERPVVAEADVLLRRGLAARGGDTIDKVSAGRWRVFEQSIAAAHQALTKNEYVGKTDVADTRFSTRLTSRKSADLGR